MRIKFRIVLSVISNVLLILTAVVGLLQAIEEVMPTKEY